MFWTGWKYIIRALMRLLPASVVAMRYCTVTSQTQDATCKADGKTIYTATVTWNGTDYTDTKTVSIPMDANNHTFDETGKCTSCGAVQTFTVTFGQQRNGHYG